MGVYIDERLNWEEHIRQVAFRVSKTIGVLSRLKSFLSCKVLKMVYNTLVLPNLTYCNLMWSNACESRINRLIVLQKNSIRIISKTPYLAHTNPLFKKLGLLKMCDIRCHQILMFMYTFSRSLLSENFVNYICEACKILTWPGIE